MSSGFSITSGSGQATGGSLAAVSGVGSPLASGSSGPGPLATSISGAGRGPSRTIVVSSLTGVALAAAFTVYIAGHVSLASSMPPGQALRRTTFGFVTVAIGMSLVMLSSRDEFESSPDYPTTLATLPTALLKNDGIDEFASQVLELQKEVDELATKRERAAFFPGSLKSP